MKVNLNQLPPDERPREKMLALGPQTLSEAELLAILIGSGSPKETAVGLMQRVMTDCRGQLSRLGRMSVRELCSYNGLGPAKAITILAACELGKRRMREEVRQEEQFQSAETIYRYYISKLKDSPTEQSHILLLNHNLRFIASKQLSHGGITGTVVDIRLALKEALLANATHIALCHNHPSGNLRPSAEDDRLTEKLQKAAITMDIKLIDHVIVTEGGYYSYMEHGRL